MQVKELNLVNFKNYTEVRLSLHPKLNCFVGNNGEGKTNLLDAIYYLCMCKSYFNTADEYSIQYNTDYMMIRADVDRNGKPEELYCGVKKNDRKHFRRNKKEYERLSEHIGLFPVVMVSPADITLISDTSEERRKYMNGVISQYNSGYLENVIRYNKVLAQRNRHLKDMRNNKKSTELLDILDEQLIKPGNMIYDERLRFIDKFTPVFSKFYNFIAEEEQPVELIYSSHLTDVPFETLLRESRDKDLMMQHTSKGVHRDDLLFNLNGYLIKRVGSQGQQKTYLVSLKLAQFEFLKDEKNMLPVLLLDDIFDKFDPTRVKQILKLVADKSFGQIFITHTRMESMNSILKELNIDHKLFDVSKGKVNEI